MTAVHRVECGTCGPMVECRDDTMMQAYATRHERETGHDAQVVVR